MRRKFIDIIRRLPLCEGAGRTNFGFVNKLEWVYCDVFSGVPPSAIGMAVFQKMLDAHHNEIEWGTGTWEIGPEKGQSYRGIVSLPYDLHTEARMVSHYLSALARAAGDNMLGMREWYALPHMPYREIVRRDSERHSNPMDYGIPNDEDEREMEDRFWDDQDRDGRTFQS